MKILIMDTRAKIIDTILLLNEKGGSTKQAIKKLVIAYNPEITEQMIDNQIKIGIIEGIFSQPKGPSGTISLSKVFLASHREEIATIPQLNDILPRIKYSEDNIIQSYIIDAIWFLNLSNQQNKRLVVENNIKSFINKNHPEININRIDNVLEYSVILGVIIQIDDFFSLPNATEQFISSSKNKEPINRSEYANTKLKNIQYANQDVIDREGFLYKESGQNQPISNTNQLPSLTSPQSNIKQQVFSPSSCQRLPDLTFRSPDCESESRYGQTPYNQNSSTQNQTVQDNSQGEIPSPVQVPKQVLSPSFQPVLLPRQPMVQPQSYSLPSIVPVNQHINSLELGSQYSQNSEANLLVNQSIQNKSPQKIIIPNISQPQYIQNTVPQQIPSVQSQSIANQSSLIS